jgi:hypothetical protein
MTHAQLVEVGAHWLRTTRRCWVVLREPRSYGVEIPDVIGWHGGFSYAIECKTSRADFVADQKKQWRMAGRRLGRVRFYLTEPGLLCPSELPEGWGLLEVNHGRVGIQVGPPGGMHGPRDQERSAAEFVDELIILTSVLRRYQAQGISYAPLPKPGTAAERWKASRSHEIDVMEARQLMRLEGRR